MDVKYYFKIQYMTAVTISVIRGSSYYFLGRDVIHILQKRDTEAQRRQMTFLKIKQIHFRDTILLCCVTFQYPMLLLKIKYFCIL
jgi:membrane protein YqaA with SNARE-associated domain